MTQSETTMPPGSYDTSNGPGWIGIDMDGTLAHYHGWYGVDHIGEPIPKMVERVRGWLQKGCPTKWGVSHDLRIFTARVSCDTEEENARARAAVEAWCLRHLGQVLPVTCVKDYRCVEIWDDRAVQLIPNTGRRADETGL